MIILFYQLKLFQLIVWHVDCTHVQVEEEFEWGGVNSRTQLQSLNSLEQQLGEAAIRWRRAGGGAFTGMKAVLVASGAKFDSYERLILAGGGKILPLTLA